MSVTLISSLQRTTQCIALKHQNTSIQGNDLTSKFCQLVQFLIEKFTSAVTLKSTQPKSGQWLRFKTQEEYDSCIYIFFWVVCSTTL